MKPARDQKRKRPAPVIPEIRMEEVAAMDAGDREILTGVVVSTCKCKLKTWQTLQAINQNTASWRGAALLLGRNMQTY